MQNRSWNPLSTRPEATRHSSYLGAGPGGLVRMLEPGRPPGLDESEAHAAVRGKLSEPGFPCVAARSALNRHAYRFGLYPPLGSAESALAICHDLYEFCHEFAQPDDRFVTFMATFRAPHPDSEPQFEQLLWQQLQRMHEVDAAHFAWDPSVSNDPDSPDFSFSIGKRAFFVVGLHAHASRRARRLSRPMIAFNFHEQFERLRARRRYATLQQAIRARDIAYQGTINPMLDDFGNRPETRQYSGRALPDDWRCPFHAAARERRAGQRRAQPRGMLLDGLVERRSRQRRSQEAQ